MKSINTYLFMALAGCFALTGCEMKNELMGDKTDDMPHGNLEVGVTLKKTGITVRSAAEQLPSTDNFPVSVVGTSTGITEVKHDFKSLTEVPKPLQLPVGTYTVSSHSPLELKQQMDEPYYAGEQVMVIQANTTTQTTVKCTMQNNRISMNYGEDFKKSFNSWTIILDDGLNHVLTFTNDNLSPADVFWLFEKDKVKELTANITAVTTSGNTITSTTKMIKEAAAKPQGIDEIYFKGGDAIQIKMGVEESPEGTITGITIKPSINFDSDNKDEFVELPTVDETPTPPVDPEEPTPPTGDAPTLELPGDITFAVNDEPKPSAVATIKTPATLKSMFVKIVPGNTGFAEALKLTEDLGLFFTKDNGVDLIAHAEAVNALFETVGKGEVKAPTADTTDYKFAIDAFFGFLSDPTTGKDEKPHEFIITVTDDNGKTTNGTLKVNITE